MGNNFHVAWCPFCSQGWVEIIKDSGNNKLLLICAECYTTWDKPIDIELNKSISYEFVGKVEIPALNEIQEIEWDKLLK